MSFRAHLELGGKEFDVLYSEYTFSRDTDKKGKPASNVYGGRVTIEIESTEDTTVVESMLNSQFKAINGKLIYKKTEEDAKMKQVEFNNSYLVYFKETLDVTGEVPMKIRFTISAEEIVIENALINNRWPKA